MEARGSEVQGQPGVPSEFQASRDYIVRLLFQGGQGCGELLTVSVLVDIGLPLQGMLKSLFMALLKAKGTLKEVSRGGCGHGHCLAHVAWMGMSGKAAQRQGTWKEVH